MFTGPPPLFALFLAFAPDPIAGEVASPTGGEVASSTVASPRVETSSLTAAVTSTSARAVLPEELVAIDPRAESACEVADGRARFVLEDLDWKGWEEFCGLLADYLRLDSGAPRAARVDEQALLDTGFFAIASCRTEASPGGVDCRMKPKAAVRDVEIEGRLPFVLLEEDLRRRVFLRPGTTLEEKRVLGEQARRIENYLDRQGFFRSQARVTPSLGRGGAEPNLGVKLELDVRSGRTLVLGEVRVRGETGLPAKELEEMLRHYWLFEIFPRRFSLEVLDEDIEAMTKKLAKKGWPEASVRAAPSLDFETGRVRLDLEVDAGARLVLVFEGNRAKNRRELEDLATFREAGSMDSVEVENTAGAIAEAYQRDGYYQVEVTPTVEDRTEGPRERVVTFQIEEGPRAKVVEVRIEGNQTFSASEVSGGAELKTHGGRLFSSGRWVDTRIARDVRAIRAYYRQNGFANARVTASRTVLPDGNLVATFSIDEGPRRMVGSLEINGLPEDVWIGEIDRRLSLRPGQPFVEDRLEADRRLILTVLAAHGYAKAAVSRQLKVPYKTEPGQASITYSVTPNERSLFGGFFLRGAFRTRDSVIEDELDLDPGEPLDLVALSDAKQRLRALGVFGSVDLRPIGAELDSRETWLLVDVTEHGRPTLDLVFSFSTATLFSLGADFRDPNFLGRAIYLDTSARFSNASRLFLDDRIGRRDKLLIELRAPHPLGLPFNAEYSAFYDYEDQVRERVEGGMPVIRGFQRQRVGATAGISRVLLARERCGPCPEIVGRLGYELASTEGVNYGGAQVRPTDDAPNSTIGRFVPQLMIRRVDSLLDPRKGYSGTVRFEVAESALAGIFEGTASFWRLLSSVELFWKLGTPFKEELSETMTLGGPFVLASGTNYGVGHPWSGSRELPVSESFDYGGDLSVRGLNERASVDAVPLANYLLTSTLELRYYFLSTSFGSFQLAGLLDAGMVARHLDQLLDEPTLTGGLAFRYVTPVGPLSLAYAWPIRLAEGIVSPGRLHFSFGYSF